MYKTEVLKNMLWETLMITSTLLRWVVWSHRIWVWDPLTTMNKLHGLSETISSLLSNNTCITQSYRFKKNVYLFILRERGRHRIQSRLQVLSCQHRAAHGAQTHEPRGHDLSQSWALNWLSHLGAFTNHFF